jgi:chromate reductase
MSQIMLLTASMRRDSCNKKLMHQVYRYLNETHQQHVYHMPDFSNFTAPLYHGDIEANDGIPLPIQNFAEDLLQSEGLIIASPEYNYSIPAALKNLIDWVSRVKPMPLAKKPILLLSASPALAGGSRGLLALEVTLMACGVLVFPRTFSLAGALAAFDQAGRLKNEDVLTNLKKCVAAFIAFISQLQSTDNNT